MAKILMLVNYFSQIYNYTICQGYFHIIRGEMHKLLANNMSHTSISSVLSSKSSQVLSTASGEQIYIGRSWKVCQYRSREEVLGKSSNYWWNLWNPCNAHQAVSSNSCWATATPNWWFSYWGYACVYVYPFLDKLIASSGMSWTGSDS